MLEDGIWIIVFLSTPLWLPLGIVLFFETMRLLISLPVWIMEWFKNKTKRCKHRWFNILNSEPIEETSMYLFAYRFLGYKEHYGLIKLNTEYDIQSRNIPEQKELSLKMECYCPRCKTKKELSNRDICLLAIADREKKNTKNIKDKNRWSWLRGKKVES